MIKKENIRVPITMPKTLHKKIQEEANYEDRSVSKQIVRILKLYYKESLDKNEE